jgi:autotransporter-associated beta strand protein
LRDASLNLPRFQSHHPPPLSGLPIDGGWSYQTFRTDGNAASAPAESVSSKSPLRNKTTAPNIKLPSQIKQRFRGMTIARNDRFPLVCALATPFIQLPGSSSDRGTFDLHSPTQLNPMKPRRLLSMRVNAAALLVRAIGLQLAVSSAAGAAQFTWDTNSGTPGAQDGGGTWGTGNSFWNGTSTVPWPNTSSSNPDEAIFGNGGTAGAITVNGIKYLNKLTFNAVGSGSYALSGTSDIRFQGSSPGITSNTTASITTPLRTDTSGTTTFTSNSGTLTLGFSRLSRSGGGARTFALGGAGDGAWTTGIINPHSDAPVSITKAGTGTWTLSGFNGYTGVTTISEGVLSTDRIGNPQSAVNLGTALTLTTTANSSTVTVVAGNTSSLTVGQTVYNINIPGGRTIASITNSATFVLSDGAGVIAGTTQPAVFGESSGLGLATADAANLVFNGTAGSGTLKYTGSTKDTGRAFTINPDKVANIDVTNSGTNLTFVGATGASTTGALTKTGTGTLTLSGTNTYTGATTVSAGTLALGAGGSISNTSIISLTAAGATLDVSAASFTLGGTQTLTGIGSVSGTVITGASSSTIAPGMSPGTLTLSTLDAAAGGTFDFELGITSDMLQVTGLLTGSTNAGDFNFNFSDAGGIAANTPYTLFTFGSQTGLDYTDLEALTLPSGMTLDSGFGTGGWLIDSDNLQVQFVPEPRAALLGGLGILVLLRRRR